MRMVNHEASVLSVLSLSDCNDLAHCEGDGSCSGKAGLYEVRDCLEVS